MSKRVAIALAHGHTAKWLQILVNSLKKYSNETTYDIYIACTWPNHPSIKAITETTLGENITLIPCTRRLYSHAVGLDEILDHIWDMGYEFMFCCETDCQAMQNGWLDWYVNQMSNPNVGMAGLFWNEGNNHYNINPSATIYRMDMLKEYHKEVRANKEGIFYHPRGNKHETDGGMDTNIKNVVGAFSETRGIKNPNPEQEAQILKGVPQASWFEPGSLIYYNSLGKYEHVKILCDHIYTSFGRHQAPEGTYYGGKNDCKFLHYWGGTRCYDFLKHPVNDHFVKECAPLWLKREHAIWMQYVPEEFRKVVGPLEDEMQLEQKCRENLEIEIRQYVPRT